MVVLGAAVALGDTAIAALPRTRPAMATLARPRTAAGIRVFFLQEVTDDAVRTSPVRTLLKVGPGC